MYLQLTHMSCLLPHCKPSTMEPTTDEPTDMEPTLSPSFGPTLRDDPETSPEPSKAPISPPEKSPTLHHQKDPPPRLHQVHLEMTTLDRADLLPNQPI